MLIHPWDSADEAQWREWLSGRDFGQLVAVGRGRDLPVVVPTHFVFDGEWTVWLHLARPNPIWPLLEENPRALLTVIGDHTYVPAAWNAPPGTDPAGGVPTSYYAAVQLECDVRVLDDPEAKAALLNRQLGHFEPEGDRRQVSTATEQDRRLLPGIRGVELGVTGVRAKFKFGGNKEDTHRRLIADQLEQRGSDLDKAARARLLDRTP